METSAHQPALSIHVTAAAEAADFAAAARTARDIRMARLDRIYRRVQSKFYAAWRAHEAALAETEALPRLSLERAAAVNRVHASSKSMTLIHARSWKLCQAMMRTAGIEKKHAG